jgi:hypothetical protein
VYKEPEEHDHQECCKEEEPSSPDRLKVEEEDEEDLSDAEDRMHVDLSDEDSSHQNNDPVNLSLNQRRTTPTPPLRHPPRRRHSATEVNSSRSSKSPPSTNGDLEFRRSVRIASYFILKCLFFTCQSLDYFNFKGLFFFLWKL